MNGTTWTVRAEPDWQELAPADPAAVMAASIGDRFHAKQGRSIARWSLGGGRLVVYLKRHPIEPCGWLARLTGPAAWSSALQEFSHLRWAAREGFRVPRAVAAGAGVGPYGRMCGFLAVEELAGMAPLHELVPQAWRSLPQDHFHAWKRGLVAELARVTRELHRRSRFHRDLYLCHFFAPVRFVTAARPEWTSRVAMIDLHRLARHRFTGWWWCAKDLAQLLYSSEVPGITPRDRLRFWRLYAGRGRSNVWRRLTRRAVVVRWNNYRGHNAPRKAAA